MSRKDGGDASRGGGSSSRGAGGSGLSSQSDGPPVSRDEFLQLFAAIGEMKGQLSSMKRDLSQDCADADNRLVKKLRLEKKQSFKKKGNKRQHDFNQEVLGQINAAQSSLDSMPPDIDKAKKALEEGEELITNRQKHIKVADRSEFGWATVEEYVADELADNSDDEKRLFKAEARAGRKVKTAKSKAKKQPNKRVQFSAARGVGVGPSQGAQGIVVHRDTNSLQVPCCGAMFSVWQVGPFQT